MYAFGYMQSLCEFLVFMSSELKNKKKIKK